jgi:poly(hydroxyalkanoate) depolymerase family esterase
MSIDFAAAMRRATEAARAARPAEATRLIQEALGLARAADAAGAAAAAPRPAAGDAAGPAVAPGAAPRPIRRWIDRLTAVDAELVPPADRPAPDAPARRPRRGLRETLARLARGRGALEAAARAARPAARAPAAPPVPEGAVWEARRFACAAGARDYRLFRPSADAPAAGVVLMLHGCRQDPDDFAAGTAMNRAAQAAGLAVVYPGQPQGANASACWNWFDPAHQRRGAGEPEILAALTRAVVAETGAPPDRVFVAGLSAGGAMAAVLGETYPEAFAAVGVHSGLPTGVACDVMSAFGAMRGETGGGRRAGAAAGPRRLIVVHGTADRTVDASNGRALYDRADAALGAGARRASRREDGDGRRGATVLRSDGADGAAAELWLVDGAGHAWAGGDAAGSWTDPAGPDATAAMLRFFLEAGG